MDDGLDRLSPAELGRLFPVRLVKAAKDWTTHFRAEKARLATCLGPRLALRIEHIGSTAIPGIATKPTLDLLVEIPPGDAMHQTIIERLTAAGYRQMRDHPTHLMFVKGYTPAGLAEISYHLHLGTAAEKQLWVRLLFRDYLIAHPQVARAYERLKLKLAAQFRYDREAYTEAKGAFIERYTRLAEEEACRFPEGEFRPRD